MDMREDHVGAWLDANLDFTHSYIIQNLKESLVHKWLSENSMACQRIIMEFMTQTDVDSFLRRQQSDFRDLQPPDPAVPISLSDAKHGGSKALRQIAEETRTQRNHEKDSENKSEVMLNLVQSFVQSELDIETLLFNISYNMVIASDALCGSFWMLNTSSQTLSSTMFGVKADSKRENFQGIEPTEVPIDNTTLVGSVATSGKEIVLENASSDPRFSAEIDIESGGMILLPIRDSAGLVTGVAQVGVDSVSVEKTRTLEIFLEFATIGIRNSQLLEVSVRACERNEVLLELAKGIFRETHLEPVLMRIMEQASALIGAERCSVFLLDHETNELYSQVFDVTQNAKDVDDGPPEIRFPANKGIAGHVATTGEPLLIAKPYEDDRFNADVDKKTGFTTRNILCMPIRNTKGEIIGVTQSVNRKGKNCFTADDCKLMEAFSVFCGLGIHNAKMYEDVIKQTYRNKVALDILSYHATANPADVKFLSTQPRRTCEELHLDNYGFRARALDSDESVLAVLTMFDELGFIEHYSIHYETLVRFVLSVKKNYRNVLYHNWMHAFSVAHAIYCVLRKSKILDRLSNLEAFALFVGCLCHDLDHRGTNNAFQSAVEAPLAQLYTTSTMEHHHFDCTLTLLNSENHNIFEHLPTQQYRQLIKYIEHAILATDLALYFKNRGGFVEISSGGGNMYRKENDQHRSLLRGMLMTACDISAITKPWEQQRAIAQIVYSEFFEQGDKEKDMLGKEPVNMMNREKIGELPKMQIGFIDFICMPIYKALAEFDSGMSPLLTGVESNRAEWNREAEHCEGFISDETSLPARTEPEPKSDDPKSDDPNDPSVPQADDSQTLQKISSLEEENRKLNDTLTSAKKDLTDLKKAAEDARNAARAAENKANEIQSAPSKLCIIL